MLLLALDIAAAEIPRSAAANVNAPPSMKNCLRTASYHSWRKGQPLTPKKLTELPPATAYMAVFRQIGRCKALMTMIEYTNRGSRR